ncbi:unnamed protein product [Porites evermanni]|uniref:FAD-binding PCMH-type domain-containing protein n=1 Tax=Porites evermanni TaxID=104178 RepID=A0ABN8SZI6_9CNID|nr:unnamed protein product [Porites evermanni]
MGNSVDCCYTTRQYNQCYFPCIRTCSHTSRRVWYNYDGLESVQPLIDVIKPEGRVIHKFPTTLADITEDHEIANALASGLDPPGQLAAICRFACNYGYRIRAVGTGSSWSRLTSTRDILIDMTNLNRILTRKPANRRENLQKEYVDIEVEGGMQVYRFVEKLDKAYGLGLPMMGNYAGQTVAGVASTSTHGSGYFSGTMSTFVVGFHLIISNGIQVKLTRGDETFDQCQEKIKRAQYGSSPVEIKSTDVFRAVAVGLGSLGIIYSIAYKCLTVYSIEEVRTVVLFGNSKDLKKLDVVFSPGKPKLGEEIGYAFFHPPNPPPHPHYFFWKNSKGKRVKFRHRKLLVLTWSPFHCFIIATFVSLYSIRTAEFCLPLAHLDEALGEVIEIANQYAKKFKQYSLLPIYVRFVKTDDLYLSPANSKCAVDGNNNDHACYIEIPFLPGAFGIEEYHKNIEDKLFTKYKARPHWGKNHHLTTGRIYELYPDLEDWKKVFRLFNATGIFCNEFTHNVGFDTCIADLLKLRAGKDVGIVNDGLAEDDVITLQPTS